MNWLRRFAVAWRASLPSAPTDRDPSDDWWYKNVVPQSAAGISVTPARAMQSAAVYACVRALSDSIAQLPLGMFRERDDGGHEPAPRHPLHAVIRARPNDLQTSFEWRQMMMASVALRGNGYSKIVPVRGRAVGQLLPLHPDLVTPELVPNERRLRYRYQDPVLGREDVLAQDEVFHLRGLSLDGFIGLDPISQAAREAVGLALGAQDFAARFVQNDGKPPIVLTHPGNYKTQEDEAAFRRAWQKAQTGANRGKVAILTGGMDIKELGVTNRNAQFLESRNFQNVDIARIFRVPPHKIGILDRATFSNIEQQAIEWVVDTLMPWAIAWEQAIGRDLVTGGDQFFAKFNFGGLLRGTLFERYQAYNIGRQAGFLSVNDIRRLEDMNPIGPQGDTYLQPSNMQPLGSDAPQGSALAPIIDAAAGRVIRREVAALRRLYDRHITDPEAFMAAAREFYQGHCDFIVKVMGCESAAASAWCDDSLAEIAAAMQNEIDHSLPMLKTHFDQLESAGPVDLARIVLKGKSCATTES